jgi:hypothetical protein
LERQFLSDLSREEVWATMEGTGWRPVSQIAIDDVCSALRFRPIQDVKSRKQVGTAKSRVRQSFVSREEGILHLHDLDRSRAFFVIIGDMVYAIAHRIAPHQPSIVGLQRFGDCHNILHSRIEPQIVGGGSA